MDLYRKKVNIDTKGNKKGKPKYTEPEYNQKKPNQNSYIKKMMPQNENFDLASAEDNVRSSMEDIFSNEDSKKKAIKYVINIGKNRNIKNSPNYEQPRRYEKSASPNRGRRYPQEYGEVYETTPNHGLPQRRGESHIDNRLTDYTPLTNVGYNNLRKNKRYNDYNTSHKNNLRPNLRNYTQFNDGDTEEYYDNHPNYINVEESQNYEISSLNEDERAPKNLRNVKPKVLNKVRNVLNDTYERAAIRVRNKDINAMPKISKQANNRYPRNNTMNTDDEIDELVQTIEYLNPSLIGKNLN